MGQNISPERYYKTMVKGFKVFKKILKWYGLPLGIIIGNLTSDYSFQIYVACAVIGYLVASFLYITDDK